MYFLRYGKTYFYSPYSPHALTLLPLQLDDVPTSDEEVMGSIFRTVSPGPVPAWSLRVKKVGREQFTTELIQSKFHFWVIYCFSSEVTQDHVPMKKVFPIQVIIYLAHHGH